MKRSAVFLTAFLSLAGVAWALDPLPEVVQEPGYSTWTLQADLPLVKLEDAMRDLKSTDKFRHARALTALGLKTEYEGRGAYAPPQIDEPIEASAQFLGFERRKMAVLTAPVKGHHRWYAVI